MFPLLFGLAAFTAGSIMSNFNHDVDIDGETLVRLAIQELNLKYTVGEMRDTFERTMDGLQANSAQVTENAVESMTVLTKDMHEALRYGKALIVIVCMYYLLRALLYLLWWRDERKARSQPVMVLMLGSNGSPSDIRLLQSSGEIVSRYRGRSAL